MTASQNAAPGCLLKEKNLLKRETEGVTLQRRMNDFSGLSPLSPAAEMSCDTLKPLSDVVVTAVSCVSRQKRLNDLKGEKGKRLKEPWLRGMALPGKGT